MTRTAWLPAIMLLAALSGCSWIQGEPGDRARGFIETLVLDPANTAKLTEQANSGGDPQALVPAVSVNIAADYLRARHEQGAALQFVTGKVDRADAKHRTVTVLARVENSAGEISEEITFQVTMEEDDNGWHILRVQGGG